MDKDQENRRKDIEKWYSVNSFNSWGVVLNEFQGMNKVGEVLVPYAPECGEREDSLKEVEFL